ncbi:ribonuclease H-like domain-containing protein, partial [Tanacetum coccineum]
MVGSWFRMFKGNIIRINETLLGELVQQAVECDALDSDVDDEPTAQSIFMASLSSTGLANLQAGNSNVIPYEQYLSDNEVSVEPSCAPSVPIDASVLHDNNAYIPHDPLVTELSIYKQQVAMYEQRAKFDLTLNEQKMDEQMRAQNPFYLRKAKVAQPAHYDGDEILKTHHVPVAYLQYTVSNYPYVSVVSRSNDENPPPPPPQQTPTQQAHHTVSTIKLPILKKVIKVLPPKTAEEILARERERKARTTLLMALPEDHLAKFNKMIDAKDMWDAIKSRFGGNDESKKKQKYILKQQFEGLFVSNSEGLHKGYDRFQSLLSQLEIHGAGVSTEDANQKFLSAQNVDFVSFESTSSTNDVITAYGVSTSSRYNSQRENSSSYTDELMYSFFANQSSGPHLDHEDMEHLDEFDLEEMDLKWKVAMIFMRLNKFYIKTVRKLHFDAKEPVRFDKTKVECYNCHKKGNFASECRSKGNTGYKSNTMEGDLENRRNLKLSNSGSYTEVTSCSKEYDKTDVFTYHKKLLAEAVKEKEELKTKLENFQSSSKGLSKLLNSQMSKRDKSRLRLSDVGDSPVHDRFANVEGMHAVPPLMTGNYIPSGPDREIDDSMFTYVWSDDPIIEEYESDSDDEYVIQPSKEQERPSFAFIDTVKHVKTPRENVIEQNTYSPSLKANKRDWNSLMSKRLGLGYGFTKKVELNKKKAVLTRTGRIPVNTTSQNFNSQAISTIAARKVNAVRPIVNENIPRNNFYKSHSPIRRPFNRTTAPRTNFSNHKVNTAGVKVVSAVRGIRETAVKPSAAESTQDYFVLPIWSSYTSTVKSSEAKNESEKPNKNTGLKTNEEPVDQDDQAFLEELERLKRQEKEANDADGALRKEFAQDTEDLLLQAEAARATSINTFNTASTPVSTASPSSGLSYPDLTYTDQDDS